MWCCSGERCPPLWVSEAPAPSPPPELQPAHGPPPLLPQPTSAPTRSWAGARKPLRSAQWRQATWTASSCTNGPRGSSSCASGTTRWGGPCPARGWLRGPRSPDGWGGGGGPGGTACPSFTFSLRHPTPRLHLEVCGCPLPKHLCPWGGGRSKKHILQFLALPSLTFPVNPDPPRPPSVMSSSTPQVFFASVRSGGSSQVYFMTLNRNCIMNW